MDSIRRGAHRTMCVALVVGVAVCAGPVDDAAGVLDRTAFADESSLLRAWRPVGVRGWQAVTPAGEDPDATDSREGTRGACPRGMVQVRGAMRKDGPLGVVEELQKRTCTRWIDRKFPERCGAFDEAAWRATASGLSADPMAFCIDRFEYPNVRGEAPWVFVTWAEAGAVCAAEQKRLCTEDEWTFACEGEEVRPYPYGFTRDDAACVIDRDWRPVDEVALVSGDPARVLAEIDRLWQGELSGSRARCRSPFGVYDMTGNVDEWTRAAPSEERPSALKGGYWAKVRARCRPTTRAHGEGYASYQQGFRCCSDVPR